MPTNSPCDRLLKYRPPSRAASMASCTTGLYSPSTLPLRRGLTSVIKYTRVSAPPTASSAMESPAAAAADVADLPFPPLSPSADADTPPQPNPNPFCLLPSASAVGPAPSNPSMRPVFSRARAQRRYVKNRGRRNSACRG